MGFALAALAAVGCPGGGSRQAAPEESQADGSAAPAPGSQDHLQTLKRELDEELLQQLQLLGYVAK